MARRCSPCDTYYPNDIHRCPGCREPTWSCKGDPHDTDWKEKSQRRRNLVRRDGKDRLPNAIAEIVERDGQQFVADEVLQNYGYLGLVSGDIIKVNDEYYECSAAVFYGSECPGWWIAVIQIDGVFTDASSEEIWANLAAQETPSG